MSLRIQQVKGKTLRNLPGFLADEMGLAVGIASELGRKEKELDSVAQSLRRLRDTGT